MKSIKIIPILLLIIGLTSGCTKNFVEINTDESTVYKYDPVTLLYQTQIGTRNSSWEMFYDYYVAQMRWSQYGVRISGNLPTVYTFSNPNIADQRYNSSWYKTGRYARFITYYLAKNYSAEERAKYSNLEEVAKITLIYEGILVSDFWGSLAYTEGWNVSSGKENENPKFETQKELYDIWDKELKDAAIKIKGNTNQASLAGYDMAFNGNIEKWVKTANALRLRIALRLLKRDPVKANTIAAEVLALGNSANIPASNDDSFIFWLEGKYSDNGDYSSVNDLIRAPKGFMTYLTKYEDPRKRMFFRINNLTPENVAEYNEKNPENKIDPAFTRWEGGTADPSKAAGNPVFNRPVLDPAGRAIDMQIANRPQTRIFSGFWDTGSGGTWFPNLTYADFCLMASEFVLNGTASGKTAGQWYTDGVRASLNQWDYVGSYCKIHDYKAMTADEISTFMNLPDIKWDDAKPKQEKLEQIYVQTYVEHYKNSNEGWALLKRTGYPKVGSDILFIEDIMVGGKKQEMPRRARFSYPMQGTSNYENYKQRIDKMKEDPDFGDPSVEFGRIWWDKK